MTTFSAGLGQFANYGSGGTMNPQQQTIGMEVPNPSSGSMISQGGYSQPFNTPSNNMGMQGMSQQPGGYLPQQANPQQQFPATSR